MTSSKFRIDKSGTGRGSGSELAALKRWAADDNAKETCLTFSPSGVKGGERKKETVCFSSSSSSPAIITSSFLTPW